MATSAPTLIFDANFDPQTGKAVIVAPGIVRITAPNPSPYTFTGTNSYVLGEERVVVVDPGPNLTAHRDALLSTLGSRPVDAIVLTHTHRDHSALARGLADAIGAPIWFGGPHRLSRPLRRFERNPIHGESDWELVPDRVLRDGERFGAGTLGFDVFATPGHCANHIALGIAGTDVMLSGDHVMGWSSTLVPVPDGSMADYLSSLETLIAAPYRRYLPGHGGPIVDGPAHARALLAHRQLRNRQIIDQVAGGARTISKVLSAVYPGLSPLLRGAARMTVLAHIEYLEARGEIGVRRSLLGIRLYPAH